MIEKRLNVLMLEDTKTDETLIKHQLLKVAPKSLITVARNKAEFIEKMDWIVPDLVLSDYNLPDMNGLEALLMIREKKSLVPFIFVTGALNNDEEVANAILQGASGFVLKGNLKQLPEKIEEVLNRMEAVIAANAEEERRWREAAIKVQKSMALLDQAPAFENKAEIKGILNEVLDAILE